jgi:3-methyl-2-oxobutanoate hydroxymethyltransferase
MADVKKAARVTLSDLREMKRRGEKIACLTCYDATFTQLLESAGIELFIVGDSLGMVIMGYETTARVGMNDMIYHAANVARRGRYAYRIVDLPYQSYETPAQALVNARRLVEEGGADMVKLEGGVARVDIVRHLVRHEIPFCGHIGLLPQSVREAGGYRVQGRDEAGARAIMEDAQALQAAGADMLVMECIPASLAAEITRVMSIPTIGIGAGRGCDGQVLVLYDMLGILSQRAPRFVKNFLRDTDTVAAAVAAYVEAVKNGSYPAAEHEY